MHREIAGWCKQERMVVVRAQKCRDRNDTIAARAVLDHDRLSPQRLQPLGKDPRPDVRACARSEWDDEFHRPLRPRPGAYCKRCGEHHRTDQAARQERPTGLEHGATPAMSTGWTPLLLEQFAAVIFSASSSFSLCPYDGHHGCKLAE